MARGLQGDVTLLNTDCYQQANECWGMWDAMAASFQNYGSLITSDFFLPFYQLQEYGIEYSDLLTACELIVSFKQMDTRFTHWGGALDLVFTMAFSGGMSGANLNANCFGKFTTYTSCGDLGLALGECVKFTFIYEAPNDTLINKVQKFSTNLGL